MSDEHDPVAAFVAEVRENIRRLGEEEALRELSVRWMREVSRHKYSYNFSWLGRPIIQFPQDIVAIQELIWSVRPEVVVETGVAHGGSLILSASILELLGGAGRVIGVDIDIRAHNRRAIEAHPLAKRIELIEGSSTAPDVIEQVRDRVGDAERVLVLLDSNHTHEHVLAELRAYSTLVRPGSYVVVFDTVIEDLPAGSFPDRPWDRGDNPKTAVHAFLRECDRFVIDHDIDAKLLVTVAPHGFLRCVKD